MTALMSSPTREDGLIHYAVSYHGRDEYLAVVVPFVTGGLAMGEPVVAMLPGANIELLSAALDEPARRQVTLLDITEVGRNPARIIPTARAFAAEHPHQRIRVVGEPVWPGQPGKQTREGIRHEACVNTLFADIDATVLCPYDTQLDAAVLAAAEETHSHERDQDGYRANPAYVCPTVTLERWNHLASPAPASAHTRTVHDTQDLAALRATVREWAAQAGLAEDRRHDLVLVIDEAASNAVVHTPGSAIVRMWADQDALVCEIADYGNLPDSFAGRLAPGAGQGGRGLWTINQLCDLVELRDYPNGTVLRMYFEHPTSS